MSRTRAATFPVAVVISLALAACHGTTRDTGGAFPTAKGGASVPTVPAGAGGITPDFQPDSTACKPLPATQVADIIHPPGPLQQKATVQRAPGNLGTHSECRLQTADGQHGVKLDIYSLADKATARATFDAFAVGGDSLSDLGDQAMRSGTDLFVLSGTRVLKITLFEPFDANEQSDSHQAQLAKILTPLGRLALQGIAALPPGLPQSTTSTTAGSRTSTTKRR